jgi:hypothetical protein
MYFLVPPGLSTKLAHCVVHSGFLNTVSVSEAVNKHNKEGLNVLG